MKTIIVVFFISLFLIKFSSTYSSRSREDSCFSFSGDRRNQGELKAKGTVGWWHIPTFTLEQSYGNHTHVRNSLLSRGWKELEPSRCRMIRCDFVWTWTFDRFKRMYEMSPCQYTNHFSSYRDMGHKVDLFEQLSNKYSPEDVEKLVPRTFNLHDPSTCTKLRESMSDLEGYWIVKPARGNRGAGIRILSNAFDASEYMTCGDAFARKTYILQQYIANPHLLEGRKYDIRQYVLVTSLDPLIVHIADTFYVRLATEKYSLEEDLLTDDRIHLTNLVVQRKHGDVSELQWSWKEYIEYVGKEKYEEKIKTAVDGIITKVLKSWSGEGHRSRTFELLGVDILVDDEFNVKVLEVNTSPGIHLNTDVVRKLHPRMIDDMFRVVLDSTVDVHRCRYRQQDSQTLGVWRLLTCGSSFSTKEKRIDGKDVFIHDEL